MPTIWVLNQCCSLTDKTTGMKNMSIHTVYSKKYAHGFVVLCFVVVMRSFIMNSHEVFIHIHQGCFAGTGAIVRLPQCQWSKPDGYGKISQCITTTKHSKAKTVCIFHGIYCISDCVYSTQNRCRNNTPSILYHHHSHWCQLCELNLPTTIYGCFSTCWHHKAVAKWLWTIMYSVRACLINVYSYYASSRPVCTWWIP